MRHARKHAKDCVPPFQSRGGMGLRPRSVNWAARQQHACPAAVCRIACGLKLAPPLNRPIRSLAHPSGWSQAPCPSCPAWQTHAARIPFHLPFIAPRHAGAPSRPRGWMLSTHPYIGKPHKLPIFKNLPLPPAGFQGLNFKIQPLVHPERLFAANGHFARFSILDAKTGTIRWEWCPFLGISTQKPLHRTVAGARPAKNR